MHLAADKLDGLAFVKELPVLNLEILGGQLCRRTEEEGQQERKEFFHAAYVWWKPSRRLRPTGPSTVRFPSLLAINYSII